MVVSRRAMLCHEVRGADPTVLTLHAVNFLRCLCKCCAGLRCEAAAAGLPVKSEWAAAAVSPAVLCVLLRSWSGKVAANPVEQGRQRTEGSSDAAPEVSGSGALFSGQFCSRRTLRLLLRHLQYHILLISCVEKEIRGRSKTGKIGDLHELVAFLT